MRYINRKGETISKDEWQELREKEDYLYVHRFDNEKVALSIEWVGRLDDRQLANLMEEYWPLYTVSLFNYGADGRPRPDPVNHGDTFATEAECKEFYEAFLIKWAGAEQRSVLDKKSGLWRDRLVVENNKYAEPGEDGTDTAAPATEANDDVGGW